MFNYDTWQEIYHSLRKNKLRTILTMIGVAWGMFLYVTLLGLAKGMENGFNKVFSGFATNSIFLWAQNTTIPYAGFSKGRELDLHLSNIDILKEKISEIDYISPQASNGNFGTGGEQMSKNGKYAIYTLNGDTPIGNKISEKKLLFGRYLNEIDISESKNVIVIGEEIYKNFFDHKKNENPIGQTISIKGILFNIVGVFRVKGAGIDNELSAFIPLSTFMKIYNKGDKVDIFAIVGKSDANLPDLEEKIKTEMKLMNNVAPDDSNAFGSINIGKEFSKLTGFLEGIQLLTIIVGTLTILAGAVAISNILLITVKERTKEIGIRRALGAKPAEVRNQILLESVFLTLSSGILGFILGALLLMLIDIFATSQDDFPLHNPSIDYSSVLLSMLIMISLGIIIGMIPAQRAVKIKPIEALRN